MNKLFALLILGFSTFSYADLEKEFSGNIEGQMRHAENSKQAREELYQDWRRQDFYLFYGNLHGKISEGNTKLEGNWFGRQTTSALYKKNYLITNSFTFPGKLVARDIFKLQHKVQKSDFQSESVLNKFQITHEFSNFKLMAGRMYINYGTGEIFNPLNPFNQPTGLTSISQVAQGNDGAGIDYTLSDNHTLDIYVLGDKSYYSYDDRINTTLWVHGEIQATNDLQIDYVFGRDQNRDKAGLQTIYQFGDTMTFAQVMYQSKNLNIERQSTKLWDVLLGADRQLTAKWHVRFEGGYQKKNPYLGSTGISDRFLPAEYFAALVNQYEIHPLVKVTGTVINDIKTGFTYGIAKTTFSLKSNLEADLFAFKPLARGKNESLAQKLITSDLGLSLRAFF